MSDQDEKVSKDVDNLSRAINESMSVFVGEGYGKVVGFRCVGLMDMGGGQYKQFEASGTVGPEISMIMKDPHFMENLDEETNESRYTLPRAKRN